MRTILSTLLGSAIVLSAGVARAQLVKQFDRTFGGSGRDNGAAVLRSADGGYLLAGDSHSGVSGDKSEPSRGGFDLWMVKTDALGNKIWDRTFGGTQPDGPGWVGEWFAGAAATQDGGYVLVATSFSEVGGDKTEPGRGGGDYWVVRVDPNGNKVWDRTIGGPSFDWADGIVATSDGGFLVVGSGGSGVGGEKSAPGFGGWSGHDYWVVKLDAQGTKQWDGVFGGGNWDSPHGGAVELLSGGYVITGTATSPAGGNKTAPSKVPWQDGDYWAVKLDAAGNKIWDRAYGGTEWDDGTQIVATQDGGFAILGISASGVSGDKSEPSRGGNDLWLVKADADGNKLWDHTYGSAASESGATGLVQTSDGGFLLATSSAGWVSGEKSEGSRGGDDLWLVKVDAGGARQWDRTMGGPFGEVSGTILAAPDGGFVLAGASASGVGPEKTDANRGELDFWLVKLIELSTLTPTVTGSAYIEAGNDCTFDPLVDSPVANRLIQAFPGPFFAMTDDQGQFGLRLPSGGYSVSEISPASDPLTLTCPGPAAAFAVMASGGSAIKAGDFGSALALTAPSVDILTHGIYPLPDTSPCWGIVNQECATFSGSATILHHPKFTLNIAGNAGATVVPGSQTVMGQCGCVPTLGGSTVTCNDGGNFNPGNVCTVCVSVLLPPAPPLPTPPPLTIQVTGTVFEAATTYAAATIGNDPVICSLDPNDLTLLRPQSCGAAAYIPSGQPLVYELHFQNTGNGNAHNVVLQDTLDPTVFDPATLQILFASKPLSRVEVFPGNLMVLSFIGIELPPAEVDPLGSVGTVVFSVRTRAGLPSPTTITNKASIIFDLNVPLITNEVINTVIDSLPPVTLEPLADMCIGDAPIALSSGAPAGGTYAGDGVSGGMFDPTAAGVGPHALTYAYTTGVTQTDYTLNQVGTFAPITGAGTGVSLGDDQVSGALPIGFPFTFYGTEYSQVYLSSNGFLTFNSGSEQGCCSGALLPDHNDNPSNLIAFAWDDLFPPGAGSIQYFTAGVAPNRVFAVTFDGVAHCCNGTPNVSAQVLLYEGTNVIEIHSTATTANNGMTMGVENDGGTFGTFVPGRNNGHFAIADDFVQFIPPAGAQLCAADATRTITVHETPTAAIAASGPTTFCAGGSVTLTASGGSSYLWSTGETTSSIVVAASGAVSVVVSDPAGCSAIAQTAVTVLGESAVCGASNNACDGPLTCKAGACGAFTPVVCAPSDACHLAGVCAPQTGLCSNPPSNACAPVCKTFRRGALGSVADATVTLTHPSLTSGSSTTIVSGGPSPELKQGLLRFDLSSIPAGAPVTSASLRLTELKTVGTGVVRLHRITAGWIESSVTWSSFASAFDPAIAASFSSAITKPAIDVTALVQGWVASPATNFGVVLEQDITAETFVESSEYAIVANRPGLVVCYLQP